MGHLRRTLEATLDDVPELAREVRELLAQDGVGGEDAALVELGIVEALNNVIEHAYGGRGGHLELEVRVGGGRVHASLRDQGAPPRGPIPPPPAPVPEAPVEREQLDDGGRGWLILGQVFDAARFERRGLTNELELSRQVAHRQP